MGKVRDEVAASRASKPPKGKPGKAPRGLFAQSLINLTRTELYKPMQGWYARVYTAMALGLIVLAGAWRVYEASMELSWSWRGVNLDPLVRGTPPAIFAIVLGWGVFRLVQFPPFAEFLIATEAEMNKVSWTSRDDLYRATTVVLTTVLLMTVFLFGVDWLWSNLLQVVGVLKFGGGGAFGSTG
jgi:preprotein translocase subunit SecE